MRLLKPLLALVVLAGLALLWRQGGVPGSAPASAPAPTTGLSATAAPGLPPEAVAMLARIRRGGPFAHAQDGAVFGNHEGLLPPRPRGYYHEYTVETPGLSHRGARRIVTGGTPPEVWYYSADHYRSFRRLESVP